MSKSWLEDNYLKRLEEAEGGMYLEDLKKLISGEAVAAIQYKFAADSIVGPNQSYLVSHFTEHSDEEWGHYSQLVSALMQRDGEAEMNLITTVNDAMPETNELESFDSEYLRQFFADAEDAAIEAYQDFYNKIERQDPDLADIINGIISDERDHKLDFTRIAEDEKEVEEEKPEEEEKEPEADEAEEKEEEKTEESEEEKKEDGGLPIPEKF